MVEVFPAKNGDCFLLHAEHGLILIDCGYVSTYRDHLKPVLQTLAKEGKRILRFIVTHIDGDHIKGAIAFLKENGDSKNPNIIGIDQIWHNSYKHLSSERVSEQLSQHSQNSLKSTFLDISDDSDKQISANQGSSFASLILENGYVWNDDFQGKAVAVENSTTITLDKELSIDILSPNNSQLQKLEVFWRKELYKLGFREKITDETIFDDAFEFLLMRGKNVPLPESEKQISSSFNIDEMIANDYEEDKTATNGSSIAVSIKIKDKKLLFLGDSHPTPICNELEKGKSASDLPLYFDFIKLSHHGSIANNSKRLFEVTDAPKYCISTNGKAHPHPSKQTLAFLVGRKIKTKPTIYFNYANNGYRLLDNKALMKAYNYEVQLADTEQNRIIKL